MSLPFIPKTFEELEGILVEMNRRLDNLDGVRGSKLSHDNLIDTTNHKLFASSDKSRSVTGQRSEKSTATTVAVLLVDFNKLVDTINDLKSRLVTENIILK